MNPASSELKICAFTASWLQTLDLAGEMSDWQAEQKSLNSFSPWRWRCQSQTPQLPAAPRVLKETLSRTLHKAHPQRSIVNLTALFRVWETLARIRAHVRSCPACLVE